MLSRPTSTERAIQRARNRMAIFSYRMGDRVRRGAGQSAVKVAAYQARENLTDERTGYAYNYRPIASAVAYIGRGDGYGEGRKEALFVGLYGPSDAPEWTRGRENIEQFWSRAELAERRQDAQIAERIIIALPNELTLEQNIWLLQDHIKEFTRQGRVVQVAIHAPEHGDSRNVHAHLLVSMRGVDERGFKASKADARERYLYRREYVTSLRERWTEAANRHLGRHGHSVRIDHRTLAKQGIDRIPTIHVGPGDSRRERHGERSAAGEINREITTRNAELVDQLPTINRALAHRTSGTPKPTSDDHPTARDKGDYWRSLIDRNRTKNSNLDPVEITRLQREAAADRVPSGWRDLTVSDIARELSPGYAGKLKEIKEIKEQIAKTGKAVRYRERDVIDQKHQRDLRWQQSGWLRKALHKIGITDRKIKEHERSAEKAEKGAIRMKTRRWALGGALATAEREAERELEKIRPQAEAALAERKQTAAAARATLADIQMQTVRERQRTAMTQHNSRRRGYNPGT